MQRAASEMIEGLMCGVTDIGGPAQGDEVHWPKRDAWEIAPTLKFNLFENQFFTKKSLYISPDHRSYFSLPESCLIVRTILYYLRRHKEEDIQWPFVAVFLTALFGLIIYRYASGIDIYFKDLSPVPQWWCRQLFYPLPYFGAVLLYCAFRRDFGALRQIGFWVVSVLALGALYLGQYHYPLREVYWALPEAVRIFYHKSFYNGYMSLCYIGSASIFYWLFGDRKRLGHFYGATTVGFDWKPYALMLAGMVPLLVIASFQPDFLEAYPRYRPGTAEAWWQVSAWWTVGLFESLYALQFVCLEIFFRGFMVMALARYLGTGAVWPMVAVYAVLHFGKPMAETCSSVFGGYILGVVALYSRSTLGGMFVHVGIALGMEALAFWHLS